MVSAAAAAPGGRGCPCAGPHPATPNRTSRPAAPARSPSPRPRGVPGDSGAVLSHGGPARPWRVSSWAREPGGSEGRVAAVVKALPWQRGQTGRGAPAVPRRCPASRSLSRGLASALRGGHRAGTASDGPGAGVTRECCFWGEFRGFLCEFDFDLVSCHVPQVPYFFNAFIYSSLTKVWVSAECVNW